MRNRDELLVLKKPALMGDMGDAGCEGAGLIDPSYLQCPQRCGWIDGLSLTRFSMD